MRNYASILKWLKIKYLKWIFYSHSVEHYLKKVFNAKKGLLIRWRSSECEGGVEQSLNREYLILALKRNLFLAL